MTWDAVVDWWVTGLWDVVSEKDMFKAKERAGFSGFSTTVLSLVVVSMTKSTSQCAFHNYPFHQIAQDGLDLGVILLGSFPRAGI